MDMLAGGEPILISRNFQTDQESNGNNYKPKVSEDEYDRVSFEFSDLVPGDFNDQMDVFLFRLASAELVRANNKNLGVEANGPSFNPSVSGDGKVIVFESLATNLQTSGRRLPAGRSLYGKPESLKPVRFLQSLPGMEKVKPLQLTPPVTRWCLPPMRLTSKRLPLAKIPWIRTIKQMCFCSFLIRIQPTW